MSKLLFSRDAARAAKSAATQVFVAPRSFYQAGWLSHFGKEPWRKTLESVAKKATASSETQSWSTLTETGSALAVVLPETISRHNAPSRAEAIAVALGRSELAGKEGLVVIGLEDEAHMTGAATAVGRAIPIFTRKNGKKKNDGKTTLVFTNEAGLALTAPTTVKEVAEASRWAASAVDTHPAEMTTALFAGAAKKLVRGLKNVKVTEIVGSKLLEQGLNAIHAVGRTAMVAPRLLILDYKPLKAKKCYALVGKGVIYDTGGLSLKAGVNMCTMKGDMGGAAAVTGTFRALAASGFKERVIAFVPLAENAIGPDSYRNDDIITMHSKKTVEINNTDAEGRLLLGDAVSYAARKFKPDVVIDAATLTGAQLIATGYRHAAVVSNRAGLEALAIRAGRSSGDLTHPLPFAPEFYQLEFRSTVADMKNSVANRSNAQSSCAGQFIYAQIEDVDPAWLHIDLAGPAFRDGRGTGFGVALMSEILRQMKAQDLKD